MLLCVKQTGYVLSVLNVIVRQTNWVCSSVCPECYLCVKQSGYVLSVCLNVIVRQTNWVCSSVCPECYCALQQTEYAFNLFGPSANP